MTAEVISPEATLGWAHLIEPAPEDDEYYAGKYTTMLWFDKDSGFKEKLEGMVEEAIAEKWSKKPSKLEMPEYKDGDEESYENDDGEVIYPNKGKWGVRVKSKRQPIVVDHHGEPITDADDLGFNPKGQVKTNAYGWEYGKSRKGVSFGLGATMITDKGAMGQTSNTDGFEFAA